MRKITLTKIEDLMASTGSGLCLMIIMFFTVISVFGRYVIGADLIPGTYNMVERVFFPLLVLWAIPMAYQQGTFPKLEFVAQKLQGRKKKIVDAVVLGMELVIYLVVTWYTLQYALEGIRIQQKINIGVDRWPAFPFLVMVPLSIGLMSIEVARSFYRKVIRENSVPAHEKKDD